MEKKKYKFKIVEEFCALAWFCIILLREDAGFS
jgi:hypothetical protein